MACYQLRGPDKGSPAFILEKMGAGVIGAADFEGAACQINEVKVVEPLAGVYGVKCPRSI